MLKLLFGRRAGLALAVLSLAGRAYGEPAVQLEEMVVVEPATSARGHTLSPHALPGAPVVNAAEAVTLVPGVEAVRRGAQAAEPVVRGLGWERVTTQAGCHPMYGACPSRMDPPATQLTPESLDSIRVIKGVPSVTLGPGATGGRVILDTDYDRGAQAAPGYTRQVDARWEEGRDGYVASAGAEGGSSNVDLRAVLHAADLGDYTSGGGVRVPAGLTEQGVALSLGLRPNDTSRLFGHAQFRREEDVDYPSLPMDVKDSETTLVTGGYRVEPAGSALERLEFNAGYSFVDHLMNNERKSNRKMLETEAPSEARSWSGKADADWRLSEGNLLTVGADAERLERDATRTRYMPATGARFEDHIWPDAERDMAGLFAEWNHTASPRLNLRAGGRVDAAQSDAASADDVIVLGPGMAAPIRTWYTDINGPEADEVDRSEVLFSGNLLAEWQATEQWAWFAGAGRTERYPAVTELYYAFSPAPGGYQIGNPGLDPETKYELTAGARHQAGWLETEASLFAAWVEDYILQTSVLKTDINGDGVVDNVRGFRNVDAELWGGELAAVARLGDAWSVPASLAYVRGRNETDGRDLPEIPPLSGRAALRYEQAAGRAWWSEAGLRFAARQDQVDEAFPEDETPSFVVYHLRGGLALTQQLSLEAGVENLFDEDYHEHLTRETSLATDELAAGDEVPAPGRSFYVKLTCVF